MHLVPGGYQKFRQSACREEAAACSGRLEVINEKRHPRQYAIAASAQEHLTIGMSARSGAKMSRN